MRPRRLTIHAFGPYAGTQVLDFDQLEGREFFLIHGPTGAGKTTVLDAICFALFGDSSGAEREGRNMRSDLAPLELQTEVELDFSIGEDWYRVVRRPEQERPKLRGEGTTIAQHEATLWKWSKNPHDQEPDTIIASRWREVGEEIERVVGYGSQQFRQVIVLPQGRFRELLTAGSRERQEILEVLFGTELYRRIEEALKGAASGVGSEVKSKRDRRSFILGETGVTETEELVARTDDLTTELERLTGLAEVLDAKRVSAQKALESGQRETEHIHERERTAAKLTELLSQHDEVDTKRQRLDRARRAAQLSDLQTARTERREEADDAGRKAAAAEAALQEATAKHLESQELLAREKLREEEREAARRLRDRLAELSGRSESLRGAREAAEVATREREVAESTVKEKESRLEAITERIETAKSEYEAARSAAEDAATLELRLRDAERLLESRRELEEAREEHRRADGRLNTRREELGTALSDLRAAQDEHYRLQSDWINGQAVVLAAELESGSPCSVCGATHHPNPATPIDGAVPTQGELDTAANRVKRAESKLEVARANEKSADQKLALKEAELERLTDELGEMADSDISELIDSAESASKAHASATAAVATAEARAGLIRKLEADHDSANSRLRKATKDLAGARDRETEARTILTEKEKELPEEFRDPVHLERAQRAAARELSDLEKALADAQDRESSTRATLKGAESEYSNATERAREATKRATEAQANFLRRLIEAGFGAPQQSTEGMGVELGTGSGHGPGPGSEEIDPAAAEADYDSARLEPLIVEQLDDEIRRYDQDLHSAREAAARAEEAARDLVLPDLQRLEAELAEADRAAREMTAKRATTAETLKRLTNSLARVREVEEEIESLEERYGVIGAIADAATGRNPQHITFQRYVLGALLDDVLVAATKRLRLMSRGRFALQRAQERVGRSRSAGLDLVVDDAHTGTNRPVSTLSGGEGFLASLSLALGLADVVQAYAGGIRLETVFIDEGFGTLDPESLDLAINTLIDLQQEGRLVGIISHVPELRERIDARLEVTTDRAGGSHARFVVG